MDRIVLTQSIAKKTGIDVQDVDQILDGYIYAIQNTLKHGHEVDLQGFGSFKVRIKKSYEIRNPKKPREIISVPKRLNPYFRADAAFKAFAKSTLR